MDNTMPTHTPPQPEGIDMPQPPLAGEGRDVCDVNISTLTEYQETVEVQR